MLTCSRSLEGLETIARRDEKIIKARRSIQHQEFPQRRALDTTVDPPHLLPMKESLGFFVPKPDDHGDYNNAIRT